MTYKLGQSSLAELSTVRPEMQALVKRAIQITSQDFTVLDGKRTREEQAEYVRRGASKTMNSEHLTGNAVDLVPWINGRARWEWDAIYPIAAAVRQAAIEQGVRIRWGGAWDRELNDLPADPAGLEQAVRAYVARSRGFIDGPHYEFEGRTAPQRPTQPQQPPAGTDAPEGFFAALARLLRSLFWGK